MLSLQRGSQPLKPAREVGKLKIQFGEVGEPTGSDFAFFDGIGPASFILIPHDKLNVNASTEAMKRILYLINPISGTQRKQGIAKLAEELTDHVHYEVELRYTSYAGHASVLASEAVEDGVDVVVAVGGDGTVNEVARALVHSHTALGILPCGSGNGLARHLHIPLNPRKAIEIINACAVQNLDYGTINGRPFFCTCGVGFDAFVSQKFAQSGRRGMITYVENTLKEGLLYKPQTYTLESDGNREECKAFLIACANASQYGNNAYIAPNASMKDGLFDVVVMEPFNAIDAPQVALQLFKGTLPANSHVKTFQADRLVIHRDGEGAAHCDGDPFLTGDTIEIEMQRGQLKVLVNPGADDEGLPKGKNLLQLLPDFFQEWTALPESLITKTGADLKRLNRSIVEKLRVKGK